ncbi:MAG: cation transporter [Candidatus Edwardsbacteria bacterium]|nr:cation transporter [Candidatus Edwardsbacteria bacterium]
MNDLVKTARRLAWFTVGYNLLEGLASVIFGISDDSIALFGFGLDSFIEVFSAVIILWRLRREFGGGQGSLERERLATRGIGALFVLLAAVVLLNAGLRLAGRVHPETALPGIVISLASLSFMYWLYTAKMRVAKALDSKALKSDAVCSLACIWLSAVLLIGSGVYYVTKLWWVDSTAALVIAGLILREGIENIRSSLQPDFDGCCCIQCKTQPQTPSRPPQAEKGQACAESATADRSGLGHEVKT